MAEILLSLTIIGVVAAITLPSLTGNINERTWNTQRKALYARMSQAIALMPALNGYGTLTEDENHSVTADTAAETFVTEGLAKVLKINNICDSDHLADCGIPDKITPFAGSTLNNFTTSYNTLVKYNNMFNSSYGVGWANFAYSAIDTKAVAFETVNGESIIAYYNPRCTSFMPFPLSEVTLYSNYSQNNMCVNFVYDLNGTKGPNTMGKDIGFMSALYPTDSVVVAPVPLHEASGWTTLPGGSPFCRQVDSDSRLPNLPEAMSMFYNFRLIDSNLTENNYIWTSTKLDNSYEWGWVMYLKAGRATTYRVGSKQRIWCVK